MTVIDRRGQQAGPEPRPHPTRELLVRSAREVLEEGGYAATSVIAIAERAGVATGSLYRHFPSKVELFVEVFRAAAEGELAAMEEAAAKSESFVGRLEAVVATFASGALRKHRLAWALVYEPVDPLIDAERLAYRRAYCERLARAVRAGIAAREIPDQDAELTAAALVGAIAEALVGPLSPVAGETASEEKIVASLLAFCRRAVGAPLAPTRQTARFTTHEEK